MPTKTQLRGMLKYYSAPLSKQLKWIWQKYGVMYEPKTVIPKALQDKGIEIIDPLHPKPSAEKKWYSPTRHPILEFLYPKPTFEMHPLWHDRKAHICDERTVFHKGIDQVCILSKTQPFNQLPDSLLSSVSKSRIKNQDKSMIKLIKLANVLDANKTLIGKKFRPAAPWYIMPLEYGISRFRKMSVLLNGMIDLCDSASDIYPELLSTLYFRNCLSYISYEVGNELIHIRKKSHILACRPTPLPAFADTDTIERSKEYKFIDLYPIYPTADMEKENIYENGYDQGWKQGFKNPFLHTFYVINDVDNLYDGSHEDMLARLTMWAFSHAAIQALNQNMKWGEVCKTPVTVQGIYILDEVFYFVIYQLNTLDVNKPEGIKNFVWFDSPKYLFFDKPNVFTEKKIILEPQIDHYICERMKYNADVFETFFAFHTNGCAL